MPDHERPVEGAIDAVDQMTTIVDSLEGFVVTTAMRDRHSTRYRLNLLWVHSVAALAIAPLLALTGRETLTAPSFAVLRSLPGSPLSVAMLIGSGGLILGMGCVFRAKRVEMVGLCLLASFYLILAVSLAVPDIQWLCGHGPKPTLYGVVVYLHLTVIMTLHIQGLLIKLRDDRAYQRIADQSR